jgi:hypothetical protein
MLFKGKFLRNETQKNTRKVIKQRYVENEYTWLNITSKTQFGTAVLNLP